MHNKAVPNDIKMHNEIQTLKLKDIITIIEEFSQLCLIDNVNKQGHRGLKQQSRKNEHT